MTRYCMHSPFLREPWQKMPFFLQVIFKFNHAKYIDNLDFK